MPIPFKLDYVIEKTLAPQQAPERQMIEKFTGVKLSNCEAQAAWNRVIEHKWYISERLGRDVGFRVAAVDFFENIYSGRNPKTNIRRSGNWLRRVPTAMQHVA